MSLRWVCVMYGAMIGGLGIIMLIVNHFQGEKGAPFALAICFLGLSLIMWVAWFILRPPRKYKNHT